MKRKLFAVCIVIALLLSLVGCIRYEATVKVYKDATADVHMVFAFSDSMAEMLGSSSPMEASPEEIAAYEAEGFTYEAYQQDGYTGYALSRKGMKISDGTEANEETGMDSVLGGEFLHVDGKHLTLDFTPFSEEDYQESGSYLSMINSYGGYMRFTLELPAKPKTHNATEVSKDGKTLTWDLTTLQANESLHAECDLNSNAFLAWLLPVIGIVAAGIVAAILLYRKSRRLKAEAAEPAAETQAPAEEEARIEPVEAAPEAEEEAPEGDAEGDAGGDE